MAAGMMTWWRERQPRRGVNDGAIEANLSRLGFG